MATQCILAVLAVPIKTIVLIWNPWEAPLEAITERGLGWYPHQLINMVHLLWLPWFWKILVGFASSRKNIYISISSGTKVVSIILKLADMDGLSLSSLYDYSSFQPSACHWMIVEQNLNSFLANLKYSYSKLRSSSTKDQSRNPTLQTWGRNSTLYL